MMMRDYKARGVPIIAIETPDAQITTQQIIAEIGDSTAVFVWDAVLGVRSSDTQKLAAFITALPPDPFTGEQPRPETITDPVALLKLADRLPINSILCMYNAHRIVNETAANNDLYKLQVVQAIWNLRDVFKASSRMLVLLGPQFQLPAELEHDVLVVSEPLPSDEKLSDIINELVKAAKQSRPDFSLTDDEFTRSVDAVRGLSAFAAEQVVALSLRPQGVDINALWERKRRVIEQTPGLSVWRGGESLDNVGGCENIKRFLIKLLSGQSAPKAIVWIDEIEKALAGSSGAVADSSGVSQDQLRVLLTYMQDHEVAGMIFIGPPGSGKSMIAKAAGTSANIPTIAFDLGAMKGSLVGESEFRIRHALKVVTAVSGDKPLFIATCNSMAVLPPELRRRFTLGIYFFDLPDASERSAIWQIYQTKYTLPDQPLPADEGWTGAEIKACCELAWRLQCSLVEAASFIVPVSKSAAEQINGLRQQAAGRFVSASKPGLFTLATHQAAVGSIQQPPLRRMEG